MSKTKPRPITALLGIFLPLSIVMHLCYYAVGLGKIVPVLGSMALSIALGTALTLLGRKNLQDYTTQTVIISYLSLCLLYLVVGVLSSVIPHRHEFMYALKDEPWVKLIPIEPAMYTMIPGVLASFWVILYNGPLVKTIPKFFIVRFSEKFHCLVKLHCGKK